MIEGLFSFLRDYSQRRPYDGKDRRRRPDAAARSTLFAATFISTTITGALTVFRSGSGSRASLSVNVELPSDDSTPPSRPQKRPASSAGIRHLRAAAEASRKATTRARQQAARFAPAGQSTQMIHRRGRLAGRTSSTHGLALFELALSSVYYSAFSPISAVLASLPLRHHRWFTSTTF